jgi:hypothetical protein
MDALSVIAKPDFSTADLAWLTGIRAKLAGNLGPPRFTLVFPGAEMEAKTFADFIRAQVTGISCIRFRLRSAVVVPEPIMSCFHVFLVPDEGFGAIVRLHDRLHIGQLEACLGAEIPYLPHLTVATETDYQASRRIAAEINAQDLSISGVIDKLEVERRRGDVSRHYCDIPLTKAGWFGR